MGRGRRKRESERKGEKNRRERNLGREGRRQGVREPLTREEGSLKKGGEGESGVKE